MPPTSRLWRSGRSVSKVKSWLKGELRNPRSWAAGNRCEHPSSAASRELREKILWKGIVTGVDIQGHFLKRHHKFDLKTDRSKAPLSTET